MMKWRAKRKVIVLSESVLPTSELPLPGNAGPNVSTEMFDLIVEVSDIQAKIASSLTWRDSPDGAARRREIIAEIQAATGSAGSFGLNDTRSLLTRLERALIAWQN